MSYIGVLIELTAREDKLNFKIEYAYQSISGWEHADKNRNYNEITIKANKLIR